MYLLDSSCDGLQPSTAFAVALYQRILPLCSLDASNKMDCTRLLYFTLNFFMASGHPSVHSQTFVSLTEVHDKQDLDIWC